MTILQFGLYALVVGAVLVGIAGCGGSQIGGTGAIRESATGPGLSNWGGVEKRAHLRMQSWMASDSKKKDLVYISDQGTAEVSVYSYPGEKIKGTLTGFELPVGECADRMGDVFIVDYDASLIFEYAHGGTSPIATLNDPGYSPAGCFVDPTTGNLAVTNVSAKSGGQGNVAIYKLAKGNPNLYFTDPNIARTFFCGYDDAGNLFVNGAGFASPFAFAELPSGNPSFRDIKLDQPIQSPGGVQWDGKHVAVMDTLSSVIYQFSIKGNKGTEVGSTPLVGGANVLQFWIEGSRVVGPQASGADVGIWSYPSGGAVKATIAGFDMPQGATISVVTK
ncbi:MAG: hypothetical protein WBE79_10055 [Candidatus Cybelea sp.]